MIPLQFILFALFVALLLYLQFYFAHRQWRRLKGEHATDIDLDYVRMENCLAQSFRMKVREWLQLPSVHSAASPGRTIAKGQERIFVAASLKFGDGEGSEDILVSDGDFTCGLNCRFTREIYSRGSAQIGRGSQLQSVAADQKLVLERGVTVARWVDSGGEIDAGPECRIGTRATSLKSIRLGEGAQALSVFAPLVSTADWDGTLQTDIARHREELLEIPLPEAAPLSSFPLAEAGLDPKKLVKLSADSWIYDGDLRSSAPLRIKSKLVVKGDCHLAGESIVADDLKAGGSLHVGPFSVCDGNLVAGTDLYLGPGCQFRGVIHADGAVLMSRGARGFNDQGQVAVYAGKELAVEPNVALCGKLASGSVVSVIGPSAAALWKKRRGIRDD